MWRGEKLLEESGSYLIELITIACKQLLHLINLCLPIDVTLEKRCIKYIWNLINGENRLYDSISKLSLCNNSTTLG